MERTEVVGKITEVLVDRLKVSADEMTEGSHFKDDLGADSLDLVDLVIGFEDKFEIKIPDEDVEQIQTVGQAADYITNQLS